MFFKTLKTQTGAMFSMDARIALVVASVLAVSIGGMQMSRIERTKVENTDVAATLILKGIEQFYVSAANTAVPTTWANVTTQIFDAGFVENQTLTTDGWGSAWVYDTCQATNVSIDGTIVPAVNYVAIYSAGKDGTNNSGTGDFLPNGTCAASYGAWSPAGDDIGHKFSTLEIEKDRVKKFTIQGREILDALTAYENRMFIENQAVCSASANPETLGRCDWVDPGGNVYEPGEEGRAHYYPRSSEDGTAANFYYVPNLITAPAGVQNTYSTVAAPANNNSMEALMELIGLTREHAVDPWGRRLVYDSNVTDALTAPFSISVEFQ